MENEQQKPEELRGRVPALRTVAMPADSNPSGDIFGGWILSNMDLAGGMHAYNHVGGRVVTVGITAISFLKPVFIGDIVSFYTRIMKIGRTSITIKIEIWAERRRGEGFIKVTEGTFTYVSIDDSYKALEIKRREHDDAYPV